MTDWWATGTGIASATATVAAVGVALWVAIRDGEQRNAERRDAEAAQARLIFVTRDHEGFRPWVSLWNASASPVLEVEIRSLTAVDRRTGQRMLATRVSVRSTDVELPGLIARVLDGAEVVNPEVWVIEGTEEIHEGWEPTGGWSASESEIECIYRYTDTAGLRWERFDSQPPQRVLEVTAAHRRRHP
ncbi:MULTISPECIES: hypothetical protein [unclassified Streptomyces]|uniref:hypothetical protein n=1 Tax=unclassified Streptomyces TaxID=2593676 RepID=UPI002251026D|nr:MULTISPECIES: hypothetical protein [unclassified Streptomyces]MCX5054620.1 hypothetical protein [Streptomyces sp. NBC_00474]